MTAALKNELTIVRMLDSPCEKVWQAFREADAIKQWWGQPDGATMPSCNVDFRVGGSLHVEITLPDGTALWFKWVYREIVEREKLVLEQHASDDEGRELDTPDRPVSTVTIGFEDLNGKTRLTIRHEGMASEAYPIEMFKEGWKQSLDRLVGSLTRT